LSTTKASVAVASCNTIAREVRECCEQLGLPVRLYSNRPACLFEEARGLLDGILHRAREHHDRLLLALGECCGGTGEVAREYNAGAVSVSRCTELLMGTGTYGWCSEHGVLLLPPAYFSTWLPRSMRDRALAAVVKSRAQAPDVEQIAAIDEGARPSDPDTLTEMEQFVGRRTGPIYTGLGHMREALRAAAQRARLPVLSERPVPIDPHTLGPGDDCLLVTSCADSGAGKGLRMVSDSIRRGLKSFWMGHPPPDPDPAAEGPSPQLEEWREKGELRVLPGEALLEAAGAAASPRELTEYWVAQALAALQEGLPGIALFHAHDWAEAPEFSTEYLLEYSARLSAACSEWPILAAWQVTPESWDDRALDELARTHPLSWTNGPVVVTREFVAADDYLGGQMTLEALDDIGCVECARLAALASALADGELQSEAARVVATHVDTCPVCTQNVADWRELRQKLRLMGSQGTPIPEGFWSLVRRGLESERE
jgi:hypothetical protein